ncbi:MAG: nitroreductase family protein [Christensenellales bacterium]
MDVFDAIRSRFSYRGQYKPERVPREHLKAIIEAGLAAPSGCNMQTTHIVGIDEPALLEKLGGMLGDSDFNTAPAGIVVLTRVQYSQDGKAYNVQDYAAAIENMLLAITAFGYASCWVEGYVRYYHDIAARMTQALGAPEGYQVVAYLPVGVAAQAGARAKKRAFTERAGFNRFSGE